MGTQTDHMTERKISSKALSIFFLLVIILSALCEWIYCNATDLIVMLLMWIPAISAFVAARISLNDNDEDFSYKKQHSLLSIRKCKFKYIIVAFLIPLMYLIVPYAIYWMTHPKSLSFGDASFIYIFIYMIIAFIVSFATATGEEIGWRGFMLPALIDRMGISKGTTIVGMFWCVWHFPLLIWGGYMEGTPLWYKLCAFILCIFPVGIIAAILTMKSGSIWPAAVLHTTHNALDQELFGAFTIGEDKMYFVSETGLLTIVCVWVIAIVLSFVYIRKDNK